ncbi:FkbM family methyltransferase [Flavisolibacter sp. BT320]|nr:FkbM family methyltransferase [Flavisolibacter longurius]
MKYFSQYCQDKFINDVVFNHKRNGFFLDIGAHDGISFSNSYFFEEYREFKGICIEPNPKVFKLLNDNRKAKNINACIGAEDGTAVFLAISGYGEMLSGLLEYYRPEHLVRIDQLMKDNGSQKQLIDVNVVTLDTIRNFIPGCVDYCSLDTEGNELAILKTIDFKKWKIKCFSIENNYDDPEVGEFMTNNHYTPLIQLGCDTIYVQNTMVTFSLKARLLCYRLKAKIINFIHRIR